MRQKKKSKFQQRLDEVAKKFRETQSEVSQEVSSQTAHTPPDPKGNLNWRHVNDELPQYYSPIHIWDGTTVHRNWARVWSETMGNIYVNNQDDSVITKITHWTAPEGLTYPKYEPLNDDDVKRYTKRDLKLIVKALTKLILLRENSKHPSVEYVQGVDDAIITLEKLIKPKRMTRKHQT